MSYLLNNKKKFFQGYFDFCHITHLKSCCFIPDKLFTASLSIAYVGMVIAWFELIKWVNMLCMNIFQKVQLVD